MRKRQCRAANLQIARFARIAGRCSAQLRMRVRIGEVMSAQDHPTMRAARAESNLHKRRIMDHPENDRWLRCPVCGKLYADCNAYLRDEAVAAGQPVDGLCERGTLRSRMTANERTRLIALPTLKESDA